MVSGSFALLSLFKKKNFQIIFCREMQLYKRLCLFYWLGVSHAFEESGQQPTLVMFGRLAGFQTWLAG